MAPSFAKDHSKLPPLKRTKKKTVYAPDPILPTIAPKVGDQEEKLVSLGKRLWLREALEDVWLAHAQPFLEADVAELWQTVQAACQRVGFALPDLDC